MENKDKNPSVVAAELPKTSEKLLPCPFCGGAGTTEDDDTGAVSCASDQCPAWYLACSIKEWNTRAALSLAKEEVE